MNKQKMMEWKKKFICVFAHTEADEAYITCMELLNDLVDAGELSRYDRPAMVDFIINVHDALISD